MAELLNAEVAPTSATGSASSIRRLCFLDHLLNTQTGMVKMTFHNVEFRPGGRLALRVNDAVAASGLSRSTLYKLMSEGKLQSVKVAGRRLIMIEDLHGLLRAGMQHDPRTPKP
jgi:excisionase family DNA binding protein